MRRLALVLSVLLILSVLAGVLELASAQVPITVWGYVKMPDGSPAAGASVTVKAGGVTKSTTAGSDGKYKVDLTVPSVPVTVTVTARKGEYKGSASKTGEGVIRIDVTLKKPSQPPPPAPSKKSTSIELSVEKREYSVGDTVVVSGRIKPAISVTVTVVVVRPGGAATSNSVKTGEDGSFTYSFVVDEPGVWKVYAKFSGNKDYRGSSSPAVKIVVKEKSQITMSVTATEPKKVVVEGTVEPPVAGATVMIYVSLDGGKTWIPLCNTTTDENGHYRVELELAVSGNLLFKAVFPGTEILAQCETKQPPVAKLPAPEEEKLRKQVEELRKREAELKERVAELESENSQLRQQVKELEERLAKAQEALEKLNATLAKLSVEAETYKGEAAQLRTTTFVGVPLAIIAGIAVGLLLSKKLLLTR